MMRFVTILLLLALSLPGQAQAQMADVTCDDSARMEHTLTDVLGAERQGTGMRDPETLLEIWVSDKNGSWIIVQSYSNGTSCIVAMGEHWEASVQSPA
ncbi:MAG: hypothetical protein AAF727_16690 [Pseudomonadota bacterium]